MRPTVTVIHRSSKSRELSAQTVRDENKNRKRREQVGSRYDQMKIILEKCVKPKAILERLVPIAEHLINENFAQGKLDRIARRRKEALICWFCEHSHDSPAFFQRLLQLAPDQSFTQIAASQSSESDTISDPAETQTPPEVASEWKSDDSSLDDQEAWEETFVLLDEDDGENEE
jgi:hypothetical protein